MERKELVQISTGLVYKVPHLKYYFQTSDINFKELTSTFFLKERKKNESNNFVKSIIRITKLESKISHFWLKNFPLNQQFSKYSHWSFGDP